MKSFFRDTGRDILVRLVVTLLVALLGAIYSSYKTTGELFTFFKEINMRAFFGIFTVILIISILSFLVLKSLKVNRKNSVVKSSIYVPMFKENYFQYGKFEHAGLNWEEMYPIPHSTHFRTGSFTVSSDNYTVYSQPYCPKCDTELTEKKAVFSRYIWKCPACKFSKRSMKNRNVLEDEANKIVKSKMSTYNGYEMNRKGEIITNKHNKLYR